jgi:hypothetical protein
MSKDFFEPLRSEPLCFEEDDELLWCDDTAVRMEIHEDIRRTRGPVSLICPHTGKVTSHDASDLRAQLEQFRLGIASSSLSLSSAGFEPGWDKAQVWN